MIDIVTKLDPRTGKVRTHEADLDDKPKVVRVMPKNEHVRRVMKHGVTRVGFPTSGGSAEWPNDTFTKRRLRDGDITLEGAAAPAAAAAAPAEPPAEPPKA